MSISLGDRIAQGTRRHRVKITSIPQELDRVKMRPLDELLIGIKVDKTQSHANALTYLFSKYF